MEYFVPFWLRAVMYSSAVRASSKLEFTVRADHGQPCPSLADKHEVLDALQDEISFSNIVKASVVLTDMHEVLGNLLDEGGFAGAP